MGSGWLHIVLHGVRGEPTALQANSDCNFFLKFFFFLSIGNRNISHVIVSLTRVLCAKLGSDSLVDVQVFTEDDSSYCVDITSTKDGKFITVNSNSRTSSEEGTCPYNFLFLCMSQNSFSLHI